MKKFFLPILLLLSTLMFSSCILIGDFDDEHTVTIRNEDYNYTIYRVDYVEENSHNWKTCWASNNGRAVSFNLDGGTYYFRVYVESDNTGNRYYVDSQDSIYVYYFSDTKLKYTGNDIRKVN